MVEYSIMKPANRDNHSVRSQGTLRNTNPVAPENSALADELRRVLKGKPTVSGFNRSLKHEIISFFAAVFKIVLVAVLCVAFAFGGFGAGMLLGYVSMTKPLSIADITQTDEVQTSFVYDSQGNVIARLTGSQNVDRIYVPISEVRNTYIEEAVISIEDERFYEHSGIDIRRIGSAVLSALANGGSATHGGSTITQQTVKLISGNDEHSTSRKIQEWFSAMSLEQELSKDEIMELYLNLAPMGNNYVGVQAAAQNYFGKNASELNLAECAFLAGLPKSPSYYNPLRESGRRNALRRQRIVLSKMYELGYITEEEYQNALNTELLFRTEEAHTSNDINSYFCEYAISEVINDVAQTRNISVDLAATIVYNRGYHIYTTLEPDVQSVLDEAFQTRDLFQQDPTLLVDYPEKPQAGMVIINVQTGAIAGMQGGYGPKPGNMVLNRATQAAYPPGSTFKMIVGLAALESGAISGNKHTSCGGKMLLGNHTFHCWKKEGHGSLNLIQALQHSCDIFFYETAQKTGIAKIAGMARKFGLEAKTNIGIENEKEGIIPDADWKRKRFGEAWQVGETIISGIGQGYILTTPVQLAVMVSRIANGGYEVVPTFEKVKDKNKLNFRSLDVSPQNLEMVKRGMYDVVNAPGGTALGAAFNFNGQQMAGKTGSAQVKRISMRERQTGVIKQEELPWKYRDHALFVAFAPYDNPKYGVAVVVEHGRSGSKVAAPIASKMLQEALRLDTTDKPVD